GHYFTHPKRGSAESVFFASANRNKKSITVDISTEQGQGLIRGMAAKADVLIENYKVGTLARYGLDYASLARINPALVYCSITGFGQTGPLRNRPGYDLVFQAMSGLMSVTGAEGREGGPQRVGFVVSDFTGGMYAVVSILAALHYRTASGAGQHIDLSLLDTQVAALSHIASNYLMTGNIPLRHGTGAPQGTPSQLYRCADREIVVVVGNEEQFADLCGVLGFSGMTADKRFCSNSQRLAHKGELNAIIQGVLLTRDSDEWLALLERANVPAGPVLDMAGVFGHLQIRDRGMRIGPGEIEGSHLAHIANPMKFSASPVSSYRDAPAIGAHTDEVLADWMGLAPQEIGRLRASKTI
ncbi:CaiB/BaiF CoA-transferase family protein, partial [Bradyrhizobium sp.]|uniref:CaiB/BaiF CoA transferase family protein n=1 Tax=Bradyrhizobium sp. TaxID=376 RepID=UPI0027368F3F